jgi:hypothetical protein
MFSLTASGSIGKTIVMSVWKGRAYARARVIPQNLRTSGQQLVRGYLGSIAKAAKAVLTAAKDTLPGLGSQFFLDTQTHIPGTQSWVATFQGNEHSSVGTDKTHYLTLGADIDDWDAGAATAGLADYVTVGDTPVTYTAGFQLYMLAKFAVGSLAYTGFAAGIDGESGTEVADFVTYCQTSV